MELNREMRKTGLAVVGFLLCLSFSLASSHFFDSDCCDESVCVDCFCLQCLTQINNSIEPSAATFDVPQKVCQKVFVCQASLDLLEPTFEIDQPPRTLL